MLSNTILASVLAALTVAAPVTTVPKLDFQVVKYDGSSAKYKNLAKFQRNQMRLKSSGINLPLENEYALYLADITIGTPGQKIQVDVDTGSSDLWVPGAGTTSTGGTYDNSKSSTYKKDKSGFKISYGDGSSASGDWALETVNVGGATITGLEFGDATTQNVGQSILGVGFKGNEAAAQSANAFTYDNLPLQMKSQGIISKASYSLYLNSLDASTGSILFGAVDKSKYSGELQMLDIVNIDDSGSSTSEAVAFFVNLDKIASAGSDLATTAYPALLDSGTTLIYAPSDIAKSIGEKYGKLDSSVGGYTLDCDTKGDDFEFTFKDKTIKVPFKDLLYNTNGKSKGDSNTCLLSVMDGQSNYYILGDAFLRSAYVYYNIDDAQVGVAQAVYNGTSSSEIVKM